MLTAGETGVTNVTVQSVWDENGSCSGPFPSGLTLFPVQPNNSTTTGIQSAPVQGPILVTN